jgi:hypothetical protein
VIVIANRIPAGAFRCKSNVLVHDLDTLVFEHSPAGVVLATGTLAREFESSVKAPRFADRRA